jgi:hypothetical protein
VSEILAYARMTKEIARMTREIAGITKMDGNRYF